jgi:TIR domain
MPATRPDFFISYTSDDVAWAHWIAQKLESSGYSTVYQHRDFPAGSAFMEQMRRAARRARRVIALFSPEYLRSPFCRIELNSVLAGDPLGLGRKLIPTRIAECRPTDLLRDRVYIDLVDLEPEAAKRRLLTDIRAAERGTHSVKPAIFPGRSVPVARTIAADESVAVYPLKVLFLASEGGIDLDFREQFRDITHAVRESAQPNAVRFKPVYDVTTETLFRALNQHSAHVVHYSGKQNGGQIVIHDADGDLTTMSAREVAKILRSLDKSTRMVIVDTCHSFSCASEIVRSVDYALGVKSWIKEWEANLFYSTFYNALAAGRTVENAWLQATTALKIKRVPGERIPQLICRKGIDPRVSLVAKRATR